MTACNELTVGSRVRCIAPSIDDRKYEGCTGYVDGFARFSVYHPREVYVVIDGEDRGAWFWQRDVQAAVGRVEADAYAHTDM